ncbi:hypothetical protein L2E82_11844 [Cichorium intybus]|uniref:Uncharacterized protein n=1 Tax=Cichorium intybus TaxID=13427 RepID=A0ACB9GFI6_CICIN|nr:hypothetical protein L2E82_11844 [Cichorium intybus]
MIEGIPAHLRSFNAFIEVGRLWGDVVVTDQCLEKNLDWSTGVVCVKTSKESRINENVEIRCGQSKYSIRAWEIDGKVFDQGFKLVTEESDNEGDDDLSDGDDDLADGDDDLVGESESEKEESDHEGDDEVSDGDEDLADGVSSENCDGQQDEEQEFDQNLAFSTTKYPTTSVEKQSSSVKENLCSVNQQDEGTRIRDSHEFEKTHKVVLEDSIGNSENLDINTPKKVAWEGSIGNSENLHFNIPKNGRSSAGKNQDKPNVDSFTFCGANNILQVNDNYEGGPRQLFEPLSVKLSVLLSRQTPIKDKLLRIQDKNEAYLEHSGIFARDNQTNTMERRVTRSQAKFQSLSQNYGGRLDRDSE